MSRRSLIRHDVRTRSGVVAIKQHVDLDELAIPDRVHVEHMGDGRWCVILGKSDLTLSVGPHGVTVVDRPGRVRGDLGAPAAPPPPSRGA